MQEYGTKQLAITQVATATTAGGTQVVGANGTRRRLILKNCDASITIYIGIGTVTSTNCVPLLAGESISLETTAAIKALSASGTPQLAYVEEYN